jgi:hypothetical protein
MIASINSWHMSQNIPNAQLIIYPDAGHAAHFQHPQRFLGLRNAVRPGRRPRPGLTWHFLGGGGPSRALTATLPLGR